MRTVCAWCNAAIASAIGTNEVAPEICQSCFIAEKLAGGFCEVLPEEPVVIGGSLTYPAPAVPTTKLTRVGWPEGVGPLAMNRTEPILKGNYPFVYQNKGNYIQF